MTKHRTILASWAALAVLALLVFAYASEPRQLQKSSMANQTAQASYNIATVVLCVGDTTMRQSMIWSHQSMPDSIVVETTIPGHSRTVYIVKPDSSS